MAFCARLLKLRETAGSVNQRRLPRPALVISPHPETLLGDGLLPALSHSAVSPSHPNYGYLFKTIGLRRGGVAQHFVLLRRTDDFIGIHCHSSYFRKSRWRFEDVRSASARASGLTRSHG